MLFENNNDRLSKRLDRSKKRISELNAEISNYEKREKELLSLFEEVEGLKGTYTSLISEMQEKRKEQDELIRSLKIMQNKLKKIKL